jgi:hypothetical protein
MADGREIRHLFFIFSVDATQQNHSTSRYPTALLNASVTRGWGEKELTAKTGFV